jgi:tRNA(Glu) U13 pseudouridine synthase TruD
LFYITISSDILEKLPHEFPTISDKMEFSEDELLVFNRILKNERIAWKDLSRIEDTGTFFSTQYRKVVVRPDDFNTSEFSKDEVNSKGDNHRNKVTLSFTLPKGSYATIVTKSIFGH